MEREHTIRAVRGLTSTEVRCDDCGYAYREVAQDRAMTHLARRQWIDHGDPDVVHIGLGRNDHQSTKTA